MAKPKKTMPSVQHNVALPLDISTKLNLHLYSEVEERIPYGAVSSFIADAVKEKLEREALL